MQRVDGRLPDELRQITITPSVSPYAEGSAEVCFGNTQVLVTASVEKKVPKWMNEGEGGWITAEYGMLPRSTHTRSGREATAGKQGGRTLEIQRLIGRSLRAAVSLQELEGITIRLDCDVLCADGGTRTAAISGGWVALAEAVEWLKRESIVPSGVSLVQIGAISVGVSSGVPLLDLNYAEDSTAEFDLNLVFNAESQLIEIQGTAEGSPLSSSRLTELLELGLKGVSEIRQIQLEALKNMHLPSRDSQDKNS